MASKQSNKSGRTNVFEVFEQSDEIDSNLEMSEDYYNLEKDEYSDTEDFRI